MSLEQQTISQDVLLEKYAKGDETSEDAIFKRVADGLSKAEAPKDQAKYSQIFYENMKKGGIGAGRIMSSAGTDIKATLINCFVQPVGDCIQGSDDDGLPGIYDALREAAETMRRGGGVGYNFSHIRPKNAFVKGTHSYASGPCSYMDVFDASCRTVESAGARRGAQMGILRIDHPDILEFITAKRTPGRWNNFNVSVGVTSDFMNAVANNESWDLVHKAEPSKKLVEAGAFYSEATGTWTYETVQAIDLWDAVMRSAYDFAEPGIIFLDNINQDNNLYYCETIEATNPCVTGDTRLATQFGLIKAIDLYNDGQELSVTVDNRSLDGDKGVQIRSAKPMFLTSASAEVFEVTTAAGYSIKATAWHDFYCQRGKIKLSELQVGDSLLIQSGKGQFGQNGSYDLGKLIGLITGDGHFTHRGENQTAAAIGLWGDDMVLADDVISTVNQLISGQSRNGRRHEVSACDVPDRNMVSIKSTQLARVLDGLYDFNANTKLRVPEVVWSGTEGCVRGYLRGLFQADGTVNINEKSLACSVRLSSSEEALLTDVQQLLANFGIYCSISLRRKQGERLMPDGHGGDRMFLCKDNFEIIIDGESRDRFMAEIGFLLPQKNEKYLSWANGKQLLKSQRFESKIISIESVGFEPVYDTTQPDHNAVIFNGLVTGQCGEQPLSPYACCDLGPVILTKFVRDPFTADASFDWASFEEVVAVQVRMLDNVLETTHWPLEEQKVEAMNKRRVGVGFTGLGDALIMLGIAYNSEDGCAFGRQIAKVMRNNAYLASVQLAIERGPFPLFDAQKYLDNGHSFASRLPDHIKDLIRKHGIRNSHLLSIAPTGTVSLAFADNASNGLEPAFSWFYDRKKRMQDGSHSMYRVEDHAYRVYRELGGDVNNLPPAFVSALEMSVNDHLAMMKAIQPYIDTSLSKTVNIPADYPYEDFKNVYMQAWEAGLKGCATYRPNNILGSVLSVAAPVEESKPEPQALEDNLQNIDPNKVVIEKRPEGALNAVAEKLSYYTKEGKKSLYLNISFMPVEGVLGGKKVVVDRPVEFFIPVGQAGESQQWISSAMRLLSLAARGGMLSRALNDMRKVVDNQSIRLGEKAKEDGTLIPQFHDSEVAAIAFAIQRILIKRGLMNEDGEPLVKLSADIIRDVDANAALVASSEIQKEVESVNTVMAGKKCPECGAHAVIKKDGCEYCTSCGHIGSCG
jgi:ribonucleoside-diphosphate reductase alpha chain